MPNRLEKEIEQLRSDINQKNIAVEYEKQKFAETLRNGYAKQIMEELENRSKPKPNLWKRFKMWLIEKLSD